jgi:hypothetical protein
MLNNQIFEIDPVPMNTILGLNCEFRNVANRTQFMNANRSEMGRNQPIFLSEVTMPLDIFGISSVLHLSK